MLPGRAAEHRLGLVPDRQDRVVGLVDGDDRRLVEHDALAADVHQRVGGTEIDRQIVREHPGQQVVEHQHSIMSGLQDFEVTSHTSTVRATWKQKLRFSEPLARVDPAWTRAADRLQSREKENIFRRSCPRPRPSSLTHQAARTTAVPEDERPGARSEIRAAVDVQNGTRDDVNRHRGGVHARIRETGPRHDAGRCVRCRATPRPG